MSRSGAESTSGNGPSSRNRAAPWIIFALATSFLLSALLTNRRINVYDEGLILTGAMRAAAGAVPHRDFYANYGPGQFYTLAGLFDIFGQTVLVERLYDATVKAGIVCVVYAIGLRLMGRLSAAIVAALCALWVGGFGFPGYPVWPAEFFILLSVLPLFVVFDRRYSAFHLISSGLCVGVVFLFRYDLGVLAVSVLSLALALYGLVMSGTRLTTAFGTIARLLLPFLGGAGMIIVPLLVLYILNGVMNDFIFQTIQFPAAHYVKTRWLPFPPIWRISASIVYFPPLAVALYVLGAVYHHIYVYKSRSINSETWVEFVILMLTVGLFFKGIVRVAPIHMAASIIPSFILLGIAVDRVLMGRKVAARLTLALLLLPAVLCVLVSSLYLAYSARRVVSENLFAAAQLTRQSVLQLNSSELEGSPRHLFAKLRRLRYFIVSEEDRQALSFALLNTGPDEPIFVMNGVNDKTFANDNSFYFLAGRQPATKWYHFDPGLQSTEAIQEQIIRDLKETKPPLVVIDTQFDNVVEPNDSAKHSGVHILDSYIRDNYRMVLDLNSYKILQRI